MPHDRRRGLGLHSEVHIEHGTDCDHSPKLGSRSTGRVIGTECDCDRDRPDYDDIVEDGPEYSSRFAHERSRLDDLHQPSLPRTAAAPSSALSPSL
jgi:hypothetical protein